MVNNTNIDALLQNKEDSFSLQDSLVLAIPDKNSSPLSINGFYFDCGTKITKKSLFVLSASELDLIHSKEWSFNTILLSEIIEILAVVDTAIGKTFRSENESSHQGKNNKNIIEVNADILQCNSIKNLVIDLIIKNNTDFNLWCNLLRRYEAYGIMRFLLSAVEKDRNVNINQLCIKYGISSSYFRQLYRENFNKTAKRKIMSVRMASAVLKLIECDHSILDIGLDSGYCSASHFTNDIKKELGLTPSDIRRLGIKLYEI